MARMTAQEGRGITFAVLHHAEQREGRAPAGPHIRIPVALHVGERSVSVGDVPSFEGLPGRVPDFLVDEIADKVRAVIDDAGATVAMYLDYFRLLELGPDLRQAAARDAAGELGPVVGLLRERAGLSRAALARQLGIHRTTQAAWERGGPTRAGNIGTLSRAAAALGYSAAAIIMAVDELSKRPVSVA